MITLSSAGAYILLALTIGLFLEGAWLLARSFGRDARTVSQRLKGAGQSSDQDLLKADSAGPITRRLDVLVPALKRQITTAGAKFTSGQFVLGAGLVGAMVLVGLNALGAPLPIGILSAAGAGFGLPVFVLSASATRRRKAFLALLPQTVDLIARSLQAGHPVTTAMALAGKQMPAPIGPEFGIVLAEMNYGLGRDAALRNLLSRFPLAELRMFAASLEMTRDTGGNVAEVLLNLGDSMRAKAQLRLKIDAASAEGRISFWVISALPLLVGGAILALSPKYYGSAQSDPLFWPLMCIPPILWAVGAATIWRMVNFRI